MQKTLPSRFLLVLVLAFALVIPPASAQSSGSDAKVGFWWAVGPVFPLQDRLSGVLSGLGQAVVSSPFAVNEFGYTLSAGGLAVEVSQSRATNTLVPGPPAAHKTRWVADGTALLVGPLWAPLPELMLVASVGVGLDKLLLQTWTGTATTLDGVLAAGGNLTLVSAWNWVPLARLHTSWRLGGAKAGLALGLSVTGRAYWAPSVWKLNDDNTISGLVQPWDFDVRPTLSLEFVQ